MMGRILSAVAIVFFMLASLRAQTPNEVPPATFEATVVPFFAKNCVVCHNDKRKAGATNLERILTKDGVEKDRETWESALQMMESGQMPPTKVAAKDTPEQGIPKPTQTEVKTVVRWLAAEFERSDMALKPRAGRVTTRRLNRSEYNNTVRDLLGVKMWPADDFPHDDSAKGFDNIGDALALSPVLMEKYLSAAERLARTAVFGPEPLKPALRKLEQLERNHPDLLMAPKEYDTTGMSSDRSMHAIHRFPVDGEYLFKVVARGFRPLGCDPLEMGLWIDGKLVTELKLEPQEDGPSLLGGRQDLFGKPLDFRTTVKAGDHMVSATVLRMYEGLPAEYGGLNPAKPRPIKTPPEDAKKPNAGAKKGKGGSAKKAPIDNQVGIDYVDVIGPYTQQKGPSAESVQKIFPNGKPKGTDAQAARDVLVPLMKRAFRRPVTDKESDRYVALVAMVQRAGDSFEEGLAVALQAILVSHDFLFRVEHDPAPGQVDDVSPYELASRLSYFLWSSMPDDALQVAAENGDLRKPALLEAQVKRMLNDDKSRAFIENFAGQWLGIRALESATPDFVTFVNFDEYLRWSMRRETELFFGHVIHDNRSILDFLDGNYSFLDERLARFYGVTGVEGTNFRKVDLTGTHRGGVLTQASVLTVTSYATRTSPVLRGKWVLENMLNAPPPAPPPNVPALAGTTKNNPKASMKEQLAIHRATATCANCHARMDPLGIGLENFDAIGAWRTKDGKSNVDASGTLPDGQTFEGVDQLKQILRKDCVVFTECLTDKMLTYALGRGLERFDKPTVKAIARKVADNDYRFQTLVIEIVQSLPFQKREAAPTKTAQASD